MTDNVRAALLDLISAWEKKLETKKAENRNLKMRLRQLEHRLGRPKELEDKDRLK